MALRETDPAEVGGYRIEDRLGSGGMGVVYLARSASGRRLAIKVVHGQYADDDEFRTRFRREVAAARQVSGAFTAPVVDADANAPRPWMATLYIPGSDLGTHVRDHGPLLLPALRELAAGLAEALRDIHRAGVVHRDLKPANVMLAADGPRVIDFGISRAAEFAAADALTQTGRVMGTPPFMSPEQFRSPHDVGPAADIFSLGSVLVYAATRRGPFDSPSPYETAVRVVEGEPGLSGVPEELLPLIRLCLEKHHKARPTPDELLALLREGRIPEQHARPGDSTARPGPEQGRSDRAGATQPNRARSEQSGHDRTPAEKPSPAQDAARPEAPAPGRRKRRFLLVTAAVAAVLAVVAATTVALSRDSDPGPSSTAAGDLPRGWKPWAARAKAPADTKGALGPDTSFQSCAAAGASLVCGGGEYMAARFALADGRATWSRPVDPTPDGASGEEGALIGTDDDRVYAYQADEREGTEGGLRTRYTVHALAADTGKVLWRTETADGETATAPNGAQGGATTVPEGVITVYGDQGDQYALLDAETGEVRWTRPKPQGPECLLRAVAGRAYLVCATDMDSADARTTISQLSTATGKPRWTVRTKRVLDVLGQDRGRLVLADVYDPDRGLTLINVSSRVLTAVRLSGGRLGNVNAYLVRGTVYFTRSSGGVRAVAPQTGRTLWETNSTVEQQGPPAGSATHVYFASPSGRVAALNARTGKVEGTSPGRDDGGEADSVLGTGGAPVALVGDALYVPYGNRSVYSVNARDL